MSEDRRIAVAMSGGVDSSTAAALLAERGEDIFGLMLRLWSPEGMQNRCCSPDDMAVARQVANQSDIPFYAIDAQEQFKHVVVDPFIDGYRNGVTPNPCLACNRHIRFGFLLDTALALGATHLATGHYARIMQTNAKFELLRAKDLSKDQSYVLSVLTQEQLSYTCFPLGDLTKQEVRIHAHRFDLPVAERPESQDLCFVGQSNYRAFLRKHGGQLPPSGPIVSNTGEILGEHQGLAFYTIGQRKGLGISSPAPLYVLRKDVSTNTLVVGARWELGRRSFHVRDVNWISGEHPPKAFRAEVRVRYKAPDCWASIRQLDSDITHVTLDEPIPDITPGQAAVFYREQKCLGGGTIVA